MPTASRRDPRTKQELLDRMMSFDFDGDIRHLGAEDARLKRVAANKIALEFPATGKTFELAVRIPRAEAKSFKPATPQAEEPAKSSPARSRARKH